MNLVSFTAGQDAFWGVTAPGGVVALSPEFPQWPTLRAVIAADGIGAVLAAGKGCAPTHVQGDFVWDIPVTDPEKIICVGVNFPDRNAEYKDGQEAPPNPSLFPRFARGFTG
ncbi:MAG TPA: 2-hydroxyhepta-2,4-diene-1,7-dioate isomerase, partial [Paenirhodobacter sp.]